MLYLKSVHVLGNAIDFKHNPISLLTISDFKRNITRFFCKDVFIYFGETEREGMEKNLKQAPH